MKNMKYVIYKEGKYYVSQSLNVDVSSFGETIQEAVRRFRKLVERSGIKKEMRRREFYEKPSEIKRRARLRAERRSRHARLLSAQR